MLFQHLFWFYSHPAVYIMVLPAMGVASASSFAAFARKRIFGYRFVAFSSLAIAVLGFLVWGHHLFVAGISIYAATVFSVLSMLVAVPSAIKVFNWTATLYEGSISWETPMLYGLGFIGLFTIGGLTGVMLATLGIDVHVHDTYFVVAHFHYVMVGGTIMGYLGGLHYWWPKISGKLYPVFWSKLSALIVFVGFNLTFFPQFLLGYLGMPRRYHSYPPEWQVLNVMSSAGATILAVGYMLPLFYFAWSMRYGRPAPATTLGAPSAWSGRRRRRRRPRTSRKRRWWSARPTTTLSATIASRCVTTTGAPMSEHQPGLAHHFDSYEQQRESASLGMWAFIVQESDVLRRPVRDLHGLSLELPRRLRRRQPPSRRQARRLQHRGADRLFADHGPRCARRAARQEKAAGRLPARHHPAGRRLPRRQGGRVHTQVARAPRARSALRLRIGGHPRQSRSIHATR